MRNSKTNNEMTNAELIQAIRNEIERLKTVQLKRIQEGDLVDAEPYDKNEAYNELLSFLDTLESEKPMNQKGLEREIERCLWKLSDDPSNEELRMFARHFAQWGAEHEKEELMKEAVEGEVVKDWDNNLSVKSGVICGFKFGEKVRVIVLPKED